MDDIDFLTIPRVFNSLGLTSAEKIALSLVYGFDKNHNGVFYGSIAYIQEWLGCTKPTAIATMKKLIEKNLVIKGAAFIDNENRRVYTINWDELKNLTGVKKFNPTEVKNFNQGGKKILPNNIVDNNINTLSTTRTREEFDFYGFFRELGADDQSLKDWKEVRRKKGGINTKSAADAILKEINKSGKSVRECIAKCASSSWSGFKWAWWLRELDEESGNNVRRNENQRINDRRRGTPPSHPRTAEEWGFGDRQKKM